MYEWDFYEDSAVCHPIADADNLYRGYSTVRKVSGWKLEVQRFRWNWSNELLKLQNALTALYYGLEGAYELSEYNRFEIYERGIPRPITALRMPARVVKSVLNELYLVPDVRKKLIYDNGASLKDKGVDFARRRLVAHLESYFREYGTNEGYVRLTDFSGFYDNIDHRLTMKMIEKYEKDDFARRLVRQALDSYCIDVSYMSDSEYQAALRSKFKLMDYRAAGHMNERRGEKLLHKSLSVGDPTSQIAAIGYPTGIDKLLAIVHGVKYYERYIDDTAFICRDLSRIKTLGEIFDRAAVRYKLFINTKKTKICPIGKTFTFLQVRYRLTETGHVVVRIGKKTIPRIRRRLKKLAVMIRNGEKSLYRAEELFRSWIGNFRRVMSKVQISGMVDLYRNLFGEGLDTWLMKKNLLWS